MILTHSTGPFMDLSVNKEEYYVTVINNEVFCIYETRIKAVPHIDFYQVIRFVHNKNWVLVENPPEWAKKQYVKLAASVYGYDVYVTNL